MCLLFLIIYKYTIKNDIGKDWLFIHCDTVRG